MSLVRLLCCDASQSLQDILNFELSVRTAWALSSNHTSWMFFHQAVWISVASVDCIMSRWIQQRLIVGSLESAYVLDPRLEIEVSLCPDAYGKLCWSTNMWCTYTARDFEFWIVGTVVESCLIVNVSHQAVWIRCLHNESLKTETYILTFSVA